MAVPKQQKDKNQSPNSAKKPASYYLKYTSIVFQMGATIGLGAFAGNWLDNHFAFKQPYLTIFLSLLAIFAALYLVIRDLTKD